MEEFLENETVEELMKIENYKEQINEEYNNLIKNRNNIRKKYYKNIEFTADAYCYLPVNLYRLIPIIKDKSNIDDNCISNITPIYIINKVKQLMKDITKFTVDIIMEH